jgi:2'-5' RNA ligase
MPRRALIVEVPEAETVVLDGFAQPGVPPHVTILFPFVDGDDLDETAIAALCSSHAPFAFELDRVERFDDGVVWLHPEPSEPFAALTQAVWRQWPDHPPYEGAFDEVIPHLTISTVAVDVDIELPIRATAREVTLIEEGTDGYWTRRRVFPLQGVA